MKQWFALLFWYAGSIANNMAAKIALRSFPYPYLLSLIGLLTQFCLTFIQYLHELPTRKHTTDEGSIPLRRILPASVGTIMAYFGHRLALKSSSVSFTLTVKSTGTVIVALLSVFIMKERLAPGQWLSIIGVMIGIALATHGENECSWQGFMFALMSATGQAIQVVWMKHLMKQTKCSNTRVLLQVLFLSTLFALPVSVYMDAGRMAVDIDKGKEVSVTTALLSGFALCWMEFGALLFLFQVPPVVHGVFNGLRSVVVIMSSVIYFGNVFTPLNGGGLLIAVVFIVVYSYFAPTKEKEKEKAETKETKEKLK